MKKKYLIILILSFLYYNNIEAKEIKINSKKNVEITVYSNIFVKLTKKRNYFGDSLSIIEKILTSSPRYKQLTKGLLDAVRKNGGTSFGITLEASPNPKKHKALGYSKNYDYNLHESYKDRSPVIARFSFDPRKKKLYEYDVISDSWKEINFDKNLLSKL